MSRKKKPRKPKNKKPRKPQHKAIPEQRTSKKPLGLVKKAHYLCCKESCSGEFVGYPGPRDLETPDPNVCPVCGSHYIKWVNYEDFALRHADS